MKLCAYDNKREWNERSEREQLLTEGAKVLKQSVIVFRSGAKSHEQYRRKNDSGKCRWENFTQFF